MNPTAEPTILERCRDILWAMVLNSGLDDADLSILAGPLTAREAIGEPGRRDFPIITGKERMIEAVLSGARGQAFTDSPSEYQGPLREALSLPPDSNRNRALLVAAINAAARRMHLVRGTVHCKDDDPENCAVEIAEHLWNTGTRSVGLAGLNPAVAEALVRRFGEGAVRVTDLDPKNVGSIRYGVEIWDGGTRWADLISGSDTVLVTGTTLVNGTFDKIHRLATEARKEFVVYGVTAAAVCRLMDFHRLCPYARE